MRVVGYTENSLSDWGGRVSWVVFTPGCNFRCPFCHNPSLVEDRETDLDPEQTAARILSRRGWLDGVVVSGGEPTLQQGLAGWLRGLKTAGISLKLDTNGSRPDFLEKMLGEELLDSVSMDIKAAPERSKYNRACGTEADLEKIRRSVELLNGSGVEVEYRTTAVPGLLEEEDVGEIARWLGEGARWVLRDFRPGNCLDGAYNRIRPFSAEQMQRLRRLKELPLYSHVDM